MNHHFLLIVHLLAASVWVGGHLYISVRIMPGCLRRLDPRELMEFEKKYEPIGMSSLVILVITGIWMSLQLGIGPNQWFAFSSPLERVVSLKLALLMATALLAVSAQTRVIPAILTSRSKLWEMAAHVILVTLIGITMLVLGTFVRYGGI